MSFLVLPDTVWDQHPTFFISFLFTSSSRDLVYPGWVQVKAAMVAIVAEREREKGREG